MKKINLFLLSIVLLAGFFSVTNLAQAGCCMGSNGNCVVASSATDCTSGSDYYTSRCDSDMLSAFCGSGSTTTTFENPLKIDSVSGLLTSLLNSLRGIIVVIAVVFMVIGGILYMTSGGNEKMVTRAKQTWTGAVVGLAIALAAPALLNEIISILQAPDLVGQTGSDITIKQIAINVLSFLLSIFGVLAIISLVIGGGMYLTAYGDEKRLDSGKKIVTYAIIGIVIALSALAVTRQIAGLINVAP